MANKGKCVGSINLTNDAGEVIEFQPRERVNARELTGRRKIFRGVWVCGGSIEDLTLRGLDLRNAKLTDVNAANVRLDHCVLEQVLLENCDFPNARLNGIDLKKSLVTSCNFARADLSESLLVGADWSSCDLHKATLRHADVRRAKLFCCDLQKADLCGASFTGTQLFNTTFDEALLDEHTDGLWPAPQGALVGWGWKSGHLVELLISAGTPRSWATTRKLRAERVTTFSIDEDRTIGVSFTHSTPYGEVVYMVGEETICKNWDSCRWNECSGGIHFFLSREEAMRWGAQL